MESEIDEHELQRLWLPLLLLPSPYAEQHIRFFAFHDSKLGTGKNKNNL